MLIAACSQTILATVAQADPSTPGLGLRDCVTVALQNHPDLRGARARVEEGDAMVRARLASFQPVLRARFGGSRVDRRVETAVQSGLRSDTDLGLDLDITTRFEIGTRVTLGLVSGYRRSVAPGMGYETELTMSGELCADAMATCVVSGDCTRAMDVCRLEARGTVRPDEAWPRVEIGPLYVQRSFLTVTQPLLAGRKTGSLEVGAARAGVDVREAALRLAQGKVAARVVRAYWELAGARERLGTLGDDAIAAARWYDEISQRLGEGLASGLDLAEARLERAAVGIELARAEAGVARATRALAKAMGVEALPPGRLAPLGPPGRPMGVDQELAAALAASPALALADARVAQAEAALDLAREGAHPRLDLNLTLATETLGRDIEETLGALVRVEEPQAMGSVVLEVPLGAGVAQARVAQARAALEEARAARRAEVLDLAHRVRDLVEDMSLGFEEVRLAEEEIRLAEVRLDAATAQARRGGYHTVLEARRALSRARLDRIGALVGLLGARASLDLLTGRLLTRVGQGLDAAGVPGGGAR